MYKLRKFAKSKTITPKAWEKVQHVDKSDVKACPFRVNDALYKINSTRIDL
jgi:hypothetical protein